MHARLLRATLPLTKRLLLWLALTALASTGARTACAQSPGLQALDAQATSLPSEAAPVEPSNATPDAVAAPTSAPAATAIVGHPFSANKVWRVVRNLPDGTQTILSQRYPILVARDTDGRIRVQGANSECDPPGPLLGPVCPCENVTVFDPQKRILTHWGEGEIAAHVAVGIRLSATEIEEIGNSTLEMPTERAESDSDGATVTTEDLGEKSIEGIAAVGARKTTVVPAGHAGNDKPITTIHEVWTSTEMKLVVKVIDGDPRGEETVRGLEHVSFSPNPALFLHPDDYEIQHPEGSVASEFGEADMADYAEWFVK